MVRIIICFLAFLFSFILNLLHAQQYYYWKNDIKLDLQPIPDKNFVVTTIGNPELLAQQLALSSNAVKTLSKVVVPKSIEESIQVDQSMVNLYWAFLECSLSLKNSQNNDIIYTAPFFRINGKEVGISQFFYVKLRQQSDYSVLEKLAQENNVKIEGRSKFMPLWYILSCTNRSTGNALEMANLFYETGMFASSQPDLMSSFKMNNGFSANTKFSKRLTTAKIPLDSHLRLDDWTPDPYFQDQWHLSNTGQYGGIVGTDINILPAWDITTGCNSIIVAVVDEGLEINHPDFNNILTTSYDAETGTSPSQVHGNHGVAVAGIIGATANNGIGVAGVAPDVKLMSISVELGVAAPLTSLKLSDGINFAWQNGAHVINNSWASDAITSQQLIIEPLTMRYFLGVGVWGLLWFLPLGMITCRVFISPPAIVMFCRRHEYV